MTSLALPWQLLITPARSWAELREQPAWHWAVIAHWLMAVLGWLATAAPLAELHFASGWANATSPLATGLSIALGLGWLVLILALTASSAGLVIPCARVIGIQLNFRQAFTWLVYGTLPYSVGILASRLLFAIVRPLADNPQHTLALMLRPFSAGPVALLPDAFPPLSFGWFICSYFDLFGIWSLAMLISGASRFLQLKARQTLWLTLELVLLSFAVITGLWNTTQYLLVH